MWHKFELLLPESFFERNTLNFHPFGRVAASFNRVSHCVFECWCWEEKYARSKSDTGQKTSSIYHRKVIHSSIIRAAANFLSPSSVCSLPKPSDAPPAVETTVIFKRFSASPSMSSWFVRAPHSRFWCCAMYYLYRFGSKEYVFISEWRAAFFLWY